MIGTPNWQGGPSKGPDSPQTTTANRKFVDAWSMLHTETIQKMDVFDGILRF